MKHIFNLSVILLSTSCLLAQNDNRLKATNQVIRDRLQDENRLKAEGYRLKETENQERVRNFVFWSNDDILKYDYTNTTKK
ncbi:MAG TPA: hypothetical protein VJK54_07325 [Chthoniobacterales bacterium]|nr:hypothetical protein [Chthoniobacterales bacterium]